MGRTTATTVRRGQPTSVTSRNTTTSSRWRPCALEAKIRAAEREVTFHVYPGTGHWFVEPNRPDVYNAAAAELVWERTLAFLHARLA
jgi:dienelactone hydrolase